MLAEWLSHEIAEKIIYDMRTQIYSHLQKLSFRFHKDSTTGDLMSRVVNDIDAMRDMLAHTIHIFTVQALTFIGIAIILSAMHLKMAILTLVPILILGPLIVHFGIKLRLISRDVRAELAEVNALLQDNLSGIFEIQAFAREPYEEKAVHRPMCRLPQFNHPRDTSVGAVESRCTVFARRELHSDSMVRRLADNQRIKCHDRWATIYFPRISVATVYADSDGKPRK